MCKDMIEFTTDISDTFHGFGTKQNYGKIDYIFVTHDVKVINADIPPVVMSDHRPYVATLEL